MEFFIFYDIQIEFNFKIMYKDFLIFGEVYYIYNRVNGSENFFCELDNYCYFMIKLVE